MKNIIKRYLNTKDISNMTINIIKSLQKLYVMLMYVFYVM